MAGIAELKDIVIFAAALGAAAHEAGRDGRISIMDSFTFLGALRKAPAALTGLGEIPVELIDMDPGEAKELVEAVEKEVGDLFPVGTKIHDVTSAALAAVPGIVRLIRSFGEPMRAEPVEQS